MLVLSCIILCLLEMATLMIVAVRTGLRTASNEIQHLLENHCQNEQQAWIWSRVPTRGREQERGQIEQSD